MRRWTLLQDALSQGGQLLRESRARGGTTSQHSAREKGVGLWFRPSWNLGLELEKVGVPRICYPALPSTAHLSLWPYDDVYLKKKKDALYGSCELSFIWAKMRTAAWETAPLIALRSCSKEGGGKDGILVILVKAGYMQSSTYFFVESFCWSREASASHEKQSSP